MASGDHQPFFHWPSAAGVKAAATAVGNECVDALLRKFYDELPFRRHHCKYFPVNLKRPGSESFAGTGRDDLPVVGESAHNRPKPIIACSRLWSLSPCWWFTFHPSARMELWNYDSMTTKWGLWSIADRSEKPYLGNAEYPRGFVGGKTLKLHFFFPHFEHRIRFSTSANFASQPHSRPNVCGSAVRS